MAKEFKLDSRTILAVYTIIKLISKLRISAFSNLIVKAPCCL
jgi:hypothetical protein